MAPEPVRTATTRTNAEQLGCDSQLVSAALHEHGIQLRYDSAKQQFRTRSELDDPNWLRQRFTEISGNAITEELNVGPQPSTTLLNGTESMSRSYRGSTMAMSATRRLPHHHRPRPRRQYRRRVGKDVQPRYARVIMVHALGQRNCRS